MFFGHTVLHPYLRQQLRQREPAFVGYKIADLRKDPGYSPHPAQKTDLSRSTGHDDGSDPKENCSAGEPCQHKYFCYGPAVSALNRISTERRFKRFEQQLSGEGLARCA